MTSAWHISGSVGGGWPAPIATVDLSHYGQSATREILPMSRQKAEADARLIAAAPSLLVALKQTREILKILHQKQWLLPQVDAAIALAEGR
jgi:hypothetical protein